MEKTQQKELYNILTNNGGNLYDFIANDYWLMSKEDLKNLSLEVVALLYAYAERQNPNNNKERDKQLHTELLENIKDYRTELLSNYFEE